MNPANTSTNWNGNQYIFMNEETRDRRSISQNCSAFAISITQSQICQLLRPKRRRKYMGNKRVLTSRRRYVQHPHQDVYKYMPKYGWDAGLTEVSGWSDEVQSSWNGEMHSTWQINSRLSPAYSLWFKYTRDYKVSWKNKPTNQYFIIFARSARLLLKNCRITRVTYLLSVYGSFKYRQPFLALHYKTQM